MSAFHLPVPGTKWVTGSLCYGVKLIMSSYLLGQRRQRYERLGINLALAYVFRSQLILLLCSETSYLMDWHCMWESVWSNKSSFYDKLTHEQTFVVNGTDINPYFSQKACGFHGFTCFCIKHLLLHLVITCLPFEITNKTYLANAVNCTIRFLVYFISQTYMSFQNYKKNSS